MWQTRVAWWEQKIVVKPDYRWKPTSEERSTAGSAFHSRRSPGVPAAEPAPPSPMMDRMPASPPPAAGAAAFGRVRERAMTAEKR